VYAVGRNKKSQKRALVVGRQLASQGFIKLVDLLMPELRSGGDLTDYLEAGEISGEERWTSSGARGSFSPGSSRSRKGRQDGASVG
jgi:hypothetical protein